jgi:predicted Zn-dependent peptidase
MANTMVLFDKTLQDFNAAAITQEDFDKAVNNIRIDITATELPQSISTFYDPITYDFQKRKNFLTDLAALKIEEVQKIVKKYFTADSYKLLIAGDEAVVNAQLNTLKGLLKYKAADIEKDN